jgi:hypothetical protein
MPKQHQLQVSAKSLPECTMTLLRYGQHVSHCGGLLQMQNLTCMLGNHQLHVLLLFAWLLPACTRPCPSRFMPFARAPRTPPPGQSPHQLLATCSS